MDTFRLRPSPLRGLLLFAIAIVLAISSLTLAPGAHAQVQQDNPSSTWRPNNGVVYAIEQVGNVIYLGGTFTSMRSPSGSTASRTRVAALDASTGQLLPWAPTVNGTVRALQGSPDGSTLYIGGGFTSVSGTSRANFAAVNTSSGSVRSLRRDTNGDVRDFAVVNNRLHVVGLFWRFHGQNRANGAAIDLGSNAVTGWNPRGNWGINTISPTPDGSKAFVGGYFSLLGGQIHNRIGQVDLSGGGLTSWRSQSSCYDSTNHCQVFDSTVSGSRVFFAIGGPGGRVTALSVNTGQELWWSGSDGDFQSVATWQDQVFGGGHFEDSVNGQPRGGLVALDASSGAVLPDASVPVIGGAGVWAIDATATRLRIGGQFLTIGGDGVLKKYAEFPVVGDPSDSTPPSRPGRPRAPAALADFVALAWSGSYDNVAVSEYQVHRNGQLVGTTAHRRFRDRSVQPDTSYTYTVTAVDTSGNRSQPSSGRSARTEVLTSRFSSPNDQWQFLSTGDAPAGSWRNVGFNDSIWASGSGDFGYGDGDEDTFISPRGVAHYFRREFSVPDKSLVSNVRLRLLRDDGAVISINGSELTRRNMPQGTINNSTKASGTVSGDGEMQYETISIPASRLTNGTNSIAVSIHNINSTSSDIGFGAIVEFDAGTPPDPEPPTQAPSGLQTTSVAATSVGLRWNAVSDATSYQVMRDGQQVGDVSALVLTNGGLTPDTGYSYTVRAVNSAGSGPTSAVLPVTTASSPGNDPEYRTIAPTHDTYVRQDKPTQSNGSSWVMRSRAGSKPQVSYLRFSIPNGGNGRALTGATLRLRTSGNGWAGSNDDFEVKLVNSNSWSESMTWDNRPTVSGTLLGTLTTNTSPNQDVTITLSAAQLAGLAGASASIALVGTGGNNIEVRSSEDRTAPAALDLTYQ